MSWPVECVEHEDHRRTLVCAENRSEVRFNNPSERALIKVRVDGCLVSDNSPRCDFIVDCAQVQTSSLVELKGTDVVRAIEQLAATLKHPNVAPRLLPTRRCVVAATRVVPAVNTQIQLGKARFSAQGVDLTVASTPVGVSVP